MGRRTGFLGTLAREMEKSANRAAADGRRQTRRTEAMQSRAIEREMVRYEREQDRSRVRAEREAERRRIAAERDGAVQRKQEAKDAQIRAWRLEYEEHQEREQDIDRIANDAPEVEDRDRLYADLAERRNYEPHAFVAPTPPNSEAKARKLRKQADHEVEVALASFRPETRGVRQAQVLLGIIGIGGVCLSFVQGVDGSSIPTYALLVGIAGVVVTQFVAVRQAKQQHDALQKTVEQDARDRLQEALDALAREDVARAQTVLATARAAHEAEIEAARTEFKREEDERLHALRELKEGKVTRMREALEATLPLDLPAPCNVSFDVHSSTVISLSLDVPEPSVVPTTEAKLLASGKVSYKEKSEKRIREQYMRLVTGLALRHASEAMLNLPTCQTVELSAFRIALDPSIGRPTRQSILETRFDYPTLAPITMDGIDPVLALKHFVHRINVGRDRDLQALDASGA
ncbi:hypothetical protein WMF28_07515 [Sorangium sp. So ce590]|uniref:hypothetical protein n=1 Tax=Sorangium sp. So ce590 TaxID=3133317 RepID=UPI003F62836C